MNDTTLPLSHPCIGEVARDTDGSDFEVVRAAIGDALRSLHSNVLLQPLPDRMAELLGQLDQQLKQLNQQKDADST
jgi:hypothetical protein